jgi:hypothetical protein
MKSIAAQLSFSKGGWFREDESAVNDRVTGDRPFTALSLDRRLVKI